MKKLQNTTTRSHPEFKVNKDSSLPKIPQNPKKHRKRTPSHTDYILLFQNQQ
jgi:hypothetical protein